MLYVCTRRLEPEVVRDAVGVGESWVDLHGHKKRSSAEAVSGLVLNTPLCVSMK